MSILDKNEILETDRAFSRSSVECGTLEAFMKFADINAIKLQNGSNPIMGIDAIRKSLSSARGTLRWYPFFVDVPDFADLGYTIGDWELTIEEPSGTSNAVRSNYVTIWRRRPDGSWRRVFDTGTQKKLV